MTIITTARGARIGYDEFGDSSAPPLVLIQGFSAQRLGWRPGFCERLADAGFRVIRFDNRDVGQSQRYPAGGYGVTDMALDVIDLLDALGLDTVHIIGQSMGGMIAQFVVEEHPSRVRSLGLLYTAASTRHFIGADAVIDRADAAPATREEFVAFYPASEAMCASTAYPQDVAWLTEVAGPIWDNGFDPDGVARQLQAVLAFTDRLDEARAIAVPTAILAGSNDRLIDSAASVELHELIAGSTLRIFPGMGHEIPEPLWNEIVDALARNARVADARTGVTNHA
jgi:pimeloyl-ACP methyl ester carboxylesterase